MQNLSFPSSIVEDSSEDYPPVITMKDTGTSSDQRHYDPWFIRNVLTCQIYSTRGLYQIGKYRQKMIKDLAGVTNSPLLKFFSALYYVTSTYNCSITHVTRMMTVDTPPNLGSSKKPILCRVFGHEPQSAARNRMRQWSPVTFFSVCSCPKSMILGLLTLSCKRPNWKYFQSSILKSPEAKQHFERSQDSLKCLLIRTEYYQEFLLRLLQPTTHKTTGWYNIIMHCISIYRLSLHCTYGLT